MRKSFARNIDLEWLTKYTTQFFEARKFDEIVALQNATGYEIVAGNSSKYKIKSDLKVGIRRDTEGFSVSLELAKETNKHNYPVMLVTFFGGGYFFLKDLKSDESWRKIEREFWQEISSAVMNAKESFNPPNS
jgi:hypothetical protein